VSPVLISVECVVAIRRRPDDRVPWDDVVVWGLLQLRGMATVKGLLTGDLAGWSGPGEVVW
jgi:hypothetical protein